MDKFDKSIKSAQQPYQPSSHFVEVTMQEINRRQPRKRWSYRFWPPILASGLAVIAVVFIVLPSVTHKTKVSNPSGQTYSSQISATNGAGSAADGTDNASLASELNSIDDSMNRQNVDENSANAALNDQSQEVTVPTN